MKLNIFNLKMKLCCHKFGLTCTSHHPILPRQQNTKFALAAGPETACREWSKESISDTTAHHPILPRQQNAQFALAAGPETACREWSKESISDTTAHRPHIAASAEYTVCVSCWTRDVMPWMKQRKSIRHYTTLPAYCRDSSHWPLHQGRHAVIVDYDSSEY